METNGDTALQGRADQGGKQVAPCAAFLTATCFREGAKRGTGEVSNTTIISIWWCNRLTYATRHHTMAVMQLRDSGGRSNWGEFRVHIIQEVNN